MRVPKETIQTWLTHGGRIYPGGTSTVASYFFAVSREDEWTSILCRRSVVVIHVGWILHCVAHSFRVPIVGYILDDDFDAGLPFSRMGIQDHILASVVSPRYPQRVSRPFVPRSQPQTPLCILPNVLQKRKRQRDSPAYPNELHSESGDSLPRRPRKRHMLSELSSSSSVESLSDIAITEVHISAVTKRNHDARSTHVVTPDICVANAPPDNHASSAPRHLTPSFKAMSKYKSQVSSFHGSSRNDQEHEKAADLNLNFAYERISEFTLTANGTSPVACPKDSSPVPAIDFTRLQFPSRNSLRFPLLRLEPVTTIAKVGSRVDGENSARPPAASNHTPNRFAQDVPSATQQPGKLAAPGTCSSRNHEDTEAALPVTRQDTRMESSSSLRRLGEAIDSRHDTVTYHMDQLIRTRKRATGRDDVRLSALWESNAMWKGMRFWHEDLKKPT
ncbi:hypothetical protein F4604DRAFT_745856 [Suillus subluteus]|nr:hypothetical protein F4604DRAFT_745856 [Suillus subluteus]